MIEKIKKLLLISRPVSWVNTAFPFGAAYLMNGGALDWEFWLGCLYFLIPFNILMYGVNDVFDYESDMKNPRKGGIEGAREQKQLHPFILKSCVVVTVPFLVVLLLFGNVASNVALLVTVFLAIAYSAKGLRFKEVPILDSITSSLHFVGPMIVGLSATGITTAQLPYIVAFFLWGAASHAFGAVQDIIPDREGNIASIATVFGAKSTVRLSFVLYIAASIVLILTSPSAAIVGFAGLAYALNVLAYLSIPDAQSARANAAWRRFIWLNLGVGFVVTMVLIAVAYGVF